MKQMVGNIYFVARSLEANHPCLSFMYHLIRQHKLTSTFHFYVLRCGAVQAAPKIGCAPGCLAVRSELSEGAECSTLVLHLARQNEKAYWLGI